MPIQELRIEGPETPVVLRFREAMMGAQGFKCCACSSIYTSLNQFSYMTEYKPRDKMVAKMIPMQNKAAYAICVECARLPEKTVFWRAQQYLIKEGGLLENNHKAIDAPGRHTKKKRQIFNQDARVRFGDD